MNAKDLAKVLRELREMKVVDGGKGVSLRDVEKKTGIKNAYLSLLEHGDIATPAPQRLHKLAEYYGVPYEKLMEAAGYMVAKKREKNMEIPMSVEAYFMSANLNE